MTTSNILASLAFPSEAAVVGRLLTGYSGLEIALMHCAKWARDFDGALKAMYRVRGETARINVADGLSRTFYKELGLGAQYERAIGMVRHCTKIRNQYAHAYWYNNNSGRLAFVDLEELAKSNDRVDDLQSLTVKYVTVSLLEQQESFFVSTERLIVWVNYEGRRLKGLVTVTPHPEPGHATPPALFVA